MRFLLAFVLSFVSVFAIAQTAPPMVLGGPQGIDVTRILVRNWMSTPIYTDTPVGPLTGAGWPARGYLITVVKNETPCQNCPPKDTSLWIYTGARWKRVGFDYVTRLVYGGQVSKVSGQNLQYLIQPYGAFFDGDYRSSLTNKVATLAPKVINNTGRIDVLVLNRDSFLVKTGIPKAIPQKPIVTGSEVEVASFYFDAFDSIPTMINTSARVTNIYRVAGIDSIYFNIDTLTFAIRDSVGITKNDTAAMLNPYKFTAVNGLTKDSTVFRLGGSLNQNTDISLNARRLSIVSDADTTRFYPDGRVSIAGVPDSTSAHWLINKKGSRLGNLEILSGLNASTTKQGIRIDGTDQTFKFQGSGASQVPATFQFSTWNGDTVPANIADFGIYLQKDVVRINQGFFRGLNTAMDTARANVLNIQPKYNIFYDSGHTVVRGIYYNPTLQALNKTTHIAYQNTTGSNLLNSTSGNTRIGYNTNDTTFKLDVNGDTRISGILRLKPSSPSNACVIINENSTDGSMYWLGSSGNPSPSAGVRNVVISPSGSYDNLTGNKNVLIGRAAGASATSASGNTFIGNNTGSSISTGGGNTFLGAGDGWGFLPSNTSNSIQLTGGGHENNRADSVLLGLTSNYAFIGGGFNSSLYINDFYLGAGHRVRRPDIANINLYAPSGFPTAVDTVGSNFTINAGRGTGAGVGGSIIFRTSSATTSGTTLQTLTERVRVSARGNLLVGTSTDDTSSLVNIVSTTKGFLQPRMTNTQRDAITTPATGLQLFSTTDSANYVYRGTDGGWQKIANEISGSATLDFPSTNGNNKSDLVINGITGASEGDVVSLGVPNLSVENHSCYTAWVSASGQVTVRFNNYGTGALDPASGTFKVKVFK